MRELLDTDRVNFLVWRYLLESNYRGAAAQLQKEWRKREPHKELDFAPHVGVYALVKLITKGLIYEDYQRQYASSQQVGQDVPATAEATARGVFGPLKFEPLSKDVEMDDEDDEESEPEPEEINDGSRKHPMDRPHHALPNGSPPKRHLLSNGFEHGADPATTPMPMEIDHAPDNHAYPSPLEGEQAASPAPHTEGPEQGTQVEKVHELTPETVFLQLGGAESSAQSPARGANENPIVLHCEWNPRDPSILAAAGTDALARVWTVSRGPAPALATQDNPYLPGHVDGTSYPFKNLLEDEVPKNATVQALAWNWTGDALALAVEVDKKVRICVCAQDGTYLHQSDGVDTPVIKLLWNPDNDFILSISPENGGTLITILSSSMANSMSYIIDHDLSTDLPLDVTWISDTEFILCGGGTLVGLRCTDTGIVPGRVFHTEKHDAFNQVQFDWHTKLIATASYKGKIDLWDGSGNRREITAHVGEILALQWQPLKGKPSDDERLLASGGKDGIICIWNVLNPNNKAKYSMTISTAILGLSMTPDGAFIAAATSDKILVWKVGEHAFPRAIWSRVPHPGWQSPKARNDAEEEPKTDNGTGEESPKANTDIEEEFIPCMAWNSDGQKLAYGANGRLAVINYR